MGVRCGIMPTVPAGQPDRSVPGPDFSQQPRGHAPLGQQPDGAVRVRGRHDRGHAHAHVEDLLQLRARHAAPLGEQREHRRRLPGRPVEHCAHVRGQDPGQVRGQPAARHVRERPDLARLRQGQAVPGVDPGRGQQLRPQRLPEFVRLRAQVKTGARRVNDAAHERVAVGVQARRRHGHDDVAGPDAIRAEQPVAVHGAGGGAGDVEVVRPEVTGVLGRLAADQRAARLHAAVGDARDDGRHTLWLQPAEDQVVRHEQRLGPAHDQVIDDHPDQVDTDRVIALQPLRDHNLGADAVGRGGQQGPAHTRQLGRVEEPGEPAEAADYFRARGPRDRRPDQVDGTLTRGDVDARPRVARLTRSGSAVRRSSVPVHLARCPLPTTGSSRCLPFSLSGTGIG